MHQALTSEKSKRNPSAKLQDKEPASIHRGHRKKNLLQRQSGDDTNSREGERGDADGSEVASAVAGRCTSSTVSTISRSSGSSSRSDGGDASSRATLGGRSSGTRGGNSRSSAGGTTGSLGQVSFKGVGAGSVDVDGHHHSTLAVSSLSAVEPQWGHFVDPEAEDGEGGCVGSHRHVSRIDTASHCGAWVGEGALGEGVVLGMEFKGNNIANSSVDLVRCESQARTTDDDVVGRLGEDGGDGDKSSDGGSELGEEHLFEKYGCWGLVRRGFFLTGDA